MKNYLLSFSSGANPANFAGLAPTFTVFDTVPGSGATTAPGITAISTTGLYYFSYQPVSNIAFVVDGFTSGLGSARYIVGMLDPNDAVNEYIGNTLFPIGQSNIALGTTNIAIGVSNLSQGNTAIQLFGASFLGASLNAMSIGNSGLGSSFTALDAKIGTTASSFGNTAVDPGTLYGYLKRMQEFNEGNSLFNKSTSLWDIYSRGSSTLLAEKTLNDSSGNVSKT